MKDWPAGTGREFHESLDSTNSEALRRAAAGERGPLWIVAGAQTAGRGRRGRPWSSQSGNFFGTLLCHPPGDRALRSFVAALGLFDAMVLVTGRPELFSLKWPNDVLLSGRKLAGILLEASNGGALAIGLGVNLATAPEAEALEAGALAPISLSGATGLTVTPEELLEQLAPAFAAWEDRLVDEGFAPLRTAWLSRAARLGEPLTARLPHRTLTGRFETIDASGALVLATETGRVTIPAADVTFGLPDAPRD